MISPRMEEHLWRLEHQLRALAKGRKMPSGRRMARQVIRASLMGRPAPIKGAAGCAADAMVSIMSRIWWLEHQLRALTKGRGMRPGRAIRRVLSTTDEQTTALTKLWHDNAFNVTIGDGEELFEAAYSAVHSCMHGKGKACHKSYTPHGVKLAVAISGGSIVARTLIYPEGGIFVKAYGEQWYALVTYLEVVAGLKLGSLQTCEFVDKIGIFEVDTIIDVAVLPEIRRCTHTGRVFRVDIDLDMEESCDDYEIIRPSEVTIFKQKVRRRIFAPIID